MQNMPELVGTGRVVLVKATAIARYAPTSGIENEHLS